MCVRKRPLFRNEQERGDVDVIEADNVQSLTVRRPPPSLPGTSRTHPPPPPPGSLSLPLPSRALSLFSLFSSFLSFLSFLRPPPPPPPFPPLLPAGSLGLLARGTTARLTARRQVLEPKTKVDLTKYTEEHEFYFDEVPALITLFARWFPLSCYPRKSLVGSTQSVVARPRGQPRVVAKQKSRGSFGRFRRPARSRFGWCPVGAARGSLRQALRT